MTELSDKSEEPGGGEEKVRHTVPGMDCPRIRHITGIRIHQLSLPDTCSRPETPSSPLGYIIPEHSTSSSPVLPRRPSHRRQPSSSTHISPSTFRSRTGTITGRRTRAPTLAGEALEQAKEVVQDVKEEGGEMKEKKLARTFITLKLPEGSEEIHGPNRKGKGRARTEVHGGSRDGGLDGHTRPIRPTLSASSSKSSINSPPSSGRSTPTQIHAPKSTNGTHRPASQSLKTTPSTHSRRRFGKVPLENVNEPRAKATQIQTRNLPTEGPSGNTEGEAGPSIPFYISPIHAPSTNPRFLSLEEGDFAPWLSVEESAGSSAIMEVWYQDPLDQQWRTASALNRRIDLDQLRRLEEGIKLPDNCILFTLDIDSKSTFYLPSLGQETPPQSTQSHGRQGSTGNGVLERSKRETRMQKGVGLGGLHQLVNIQAVTADTQRGIAQVQLKIDQLLRQDIGGRALRRDVSEREHTLKWYRNKVDEVEKETEEVHAKVTLRRKALDERRKRLREAENKGDHLRAKLSELEIDLETAETDRSSLVPAIHHTRSQHVQALDSLFPISPLHGPSLLYTILDIPLPIPTGAKDPAPPLVMTLPDGKGKVDEKTTAAALGYVAMVVQVLGNLSGMRKEGGLSYPITCAGSRSLVKDTISVMQGPRSFPLYAKGVERYRYEYAVFLLNKNIEMLMQEASIRMVDLRHTLPNLKSLLLTLSSPTPPPQRRLPTSSAFQSRMTSRQTSQAYSIPQFSPGNTGGTGTTLVSGYDSLEGSPIKRVVKGRRSRLGRGSVVGDEGESDLETETGTMDDTETGTGDLELGTDRSIVASP